MTMDGRKRTVFELLLQGRVISASVLCSNLSGSYVLISLFEIQF